MRTTFVKTLIDLARKDERIFLLTPDMGYSVLEPFRDETINYVESLKRENIPVIFKFYKTCYHGFDIILGNKGVGKDALDFTYNSYAEFYDKYI